MRFETIDRRGTRALKYEARQERFGDAEVLPLWVADMDLAAPPCVQEAIRRRATHPVYGYTVFDEAFFDAVQRWYEVRYGWPIKREWIVPGNGVVPALNTAVEAFSAQGDGVIIQPPIYPPFYSAVKHRKRKVHENVLRYDGTRYKMDTADLEAKAADASMLLLCSPHNPTGRVWSEAELTAVGEIAARHDLVVVSDEIHADIVYGSFTTMGRIETLRERLVVLHAPSKTFNIAGLHTSFAVIPSASLRRRFIAEQARGGWSGDADPFGVEATVAAYRHGEAWLEALIARLRRNVAWVCEALRDTPVVPVVPEATFLMWLDCRAMGLDDAALQEFFVSKARLGLNPGISFGRGGEGFMRLNIAVSHAVLQEATERLKEALA